MGYFDVIKPKRKRLLSDADKKRIAAKQKWNCKRCGKPLPARYNIDHIKEFSQGGSDTDSNLQALCPNCHADKTEDDRHKKKQQKIRKVEQKEKDPFGLSSFGGTSKSKNPYAIKLPKSEFGLNMSNFGLDSKPKKGKKQKGLFGDLPRF